MTALLDLPRQTRPSRPALDQLPSAPLRSPRPRVTSGVKAGPPVLFAPAPPRQPVGKRREVRRGRPEARRCGLPPAAASVPLRLTFRGCVLASVLVGLCLLGILAIAAAHTEGGGAPTAPASVVVQPGDTLWQIAAEASPAEDPLVVVNRIRQANGLDRSALQPGQLLVLPAG